MKRLVRAVVCGSLMLAGCTVARDAAVTSYHVATAPVRLIARQFEDEPPQTTRPSDVDVPGHPVAAPSPRAASRQRTVTTSASQGAKHNPRAEVKSKTAASTGRPPTTQAEFPVGKPVPGKPGYVYSPYDPNKYVDVSGYTPGSKVKDPYAQKIFIVP